MNSKLLFILCFGLCCFHAPHDVAAQVYTYVTKEGEKVYVTDPTSVPEEYRSQVLKPHQLPNLTRSGGGGEFRSIESIQERHDRFKRQQFPSVEIFVTSWCPYCLKAEAFLRKNKVPFDRYDIERDKKGKQRYLSLGGGGVPILRIGQEVLRGYDEVGMRRALGL